MIEDVPGGGAVTVGGKHVLVSIVVPIAEGDVKPTSAVALVVWKEEGLAGGGKLAAVEVAVLSDVFVAIDERFDAGHEKVEVAVVIQVAEGVELASVDLSSFIIFDEIIAVTDQAGISFGLAQPGLEGIEIDGITGTGMVGHNETQGDFVDAVVFLNPVGQEIFFIAGA